MKQYLIFLSLVACMVMGGCKKVKDFQFKRIVSWRINNLDLNKGSIAAELLFYNPNRFPLQFRHLEGNVRLEGKEIGFCNADTVLRIEPEQNFILPVTVNLQPVSVISAGLTLMSRDSIMVGFDGFARVGRSGVFINYKFSGDTKVATNFR